MYKPRTATLINSIIVLLLLVVLFEVWRTDSLRKNKYDEIEAAVKTIKKDNSLTRALHQDMNRLYEADNNFRLYAATYNTSYFTKYRSDLQAVYMAFDSLAQLKNDSLAKPEGSRGFGQDFQKKMVLNGIILELRHVVDSLLLMALHFDSLNSSIKLPTGKNFYQKKTVLDTTIEGSGAKKKSLFQRIKKAISGKVDNDTIKINMKQDISLDEDDRLNMLNIMIKKTGHQYQDQLMQQVAIKNKLNEKETELVFINILLIKKLGNLFDDFQNLEQKEEEIRRNRALDLIMQSGNKLSAYASEAFMIIILLTSLVLYNIWRVNTNASKLLAARLEAEKQVKIKADFMASVSHEIRNPLTAIIGFVGHLDAAGLSGNQKQHLQSVKAASDMLLSTVNDILDFSKLQASKMQFQSAAFDLRKAIKEVIIIMTPLAERKGLILLEDTSSLNTELMITGDVFRLKQVLVNLVSNSIKFTHRGNITIKTGPLTATSVLSPKQGASQKNVLLKISVMDTGIGIPKNKLHDIFNEFVQIDHKSSTPIGTGLGLVICKKIVEMQNGSITASSEPGNGSVFTIEIPYLLAGPLPEKTPLNPVSEKTIHSFRGKKILLVDDNPLILQLGAMLLQKNDFNITTAENGEMAMKLVQENNFDMVITDIHLPGISGKELAAGIRRLKDVHKAGIPILALTGYVFDDEAKTYLSTGFNNFIIKPFNEKDILAELAKYF